MSFVTAQPEALALAAEQLRAAGSTLAAENTAAAASTTAVAPAAADQVSALQAAVFGAYGTAYQTVATQAHAVHEALVTTLRASAGSYAEAEGINQSSATLTAASAGSPIDVLSTLLGGPSPSLNGRPFSLSSNAVNLFHTGMTNWVAATSDLLGLTGGGLIPDATAETGAAASAAVGAVLTGSPPAAAAAATGDASPGLVSAGLGQAAAAGKLSVPHAWSEAGGATTSGSVPDRPAGPRPAPGAAIPAVVPAVAAARARGDHGSPRYGVRPAVMRKPPVA